MKASRHLIALAGSAAMLVSGPLATASASTATDTYPQTPATNNVLPIVHTYHGSDHLKANILNPAPVCNAAEDYRTTVYKATDSFTPAGTISTTNDTTAPIPLTQTLSKTQSISLSVKGDLSNTASLNIGGGASTSQGGNSANVSNGITASLTRSLGASLSYSLSWTAGQQVGPYQVPAGFTGEATYGFRLINLTGTQQFCKANGTWSNPTFWSAMAPIKNEVRVKLYDNAAGSSQDVGSSVRTNSPTYGEAPADPAVAVDGVDAKDFDLKPYFTVSGAKSAGFAGSVALRVQNLGAKQYYKDVKAPTRFVVSVRTQSGPQGVDRLITTAGHNGAYVRDLGFDRATSTRKFEVTLSNPVEPGQDQLVAAFSFGDGATKLGRIVNYATVTQTGRIAGDVSAANDQDQDSRQVSRDDFGKSIVGLF